MIINHVRMDKDVNYHDNSCDIVKNKIGSIR